MREGETRFQDSPGGWHQKWQVRKKQGVEIVEWMSAVSTPRSAGLSRVTSGLRREQILLYTCLNINSKTRCCGNFSIPELFLKTDEPGSEGGRNTLSKQSWGVTSGDSVQEEREVRKSPVDERGQHAAVCWLLARGVGPALGENLTTHMLKCY